MLIQLIFLSALSFAAFQADEACPLGWLSCGDTCIQTILDPATSDKAKIYCESIGGQLFHCDGQPEIEDVADRLNVLFEKGLLESTWLLGSHSEVPRIITRKNESQYVISSVPSSASFPFVCSLNSVQRRTLFFQQQLMPRGAPHFTSLPPSEIYFHQRNGADFIPLSCAVESKQPTTIKWFKNDVQMIRPSTSNESYLLSGGTLLVPAISSLAYSTFHCVAENKYGIIRGPSILLKPAFIDAFSSHRNDVLPLIEGGAQLDCHAPNHQPKSLSFSWLHGSSDRVVQQSARVFISLDGTLLFSHVDPDDDERYSCALALLSTQSGHYGPFFRLRVTGAQGTFVPRMHPNQPQVFPEAPIVGDTVYIECFAFANPTPVYQWSRTDGRPLSKRITVTNFGRVIRIEGVEHSDIGRYRCTATNSLGTAEAEVSLYLKESPTVLIPLSDRLVPSNTSFSLECPLSTADKTSMVEWFKDGDPIVPLLMPFEQRKRFTVNRNRLQVSSSHSSDSGVYQCMISNDIGVSTSSAHISVRDSAPVFPAQAMPLKVFAVKGTTLSVPCVYQASPRGFSKWTDAGGNRIPKKGRVRDEKGSLHIENVFEDDSGLFFCTAHNRIGKAHTQIHLTVLDEPRVHVFTENEGIPGERMNISCEIEMDCSSPDKCPEALVQWTENDLPVKTGGNLRTKVLEQSSPFKHSQRLKQKVDLEMSYGERALGRFACSSIVGGASIEWANRQLPPAPIGVKAEKETHGIRLSWRMPPQHRETRDHQVNTVKGFLVEMRTRSERRWRSAPREIVGKEEAEGFILRNLQPNSQYQFRLRSLDASSRGDPSIPSEWIHTNPSVPQNTVDGIRWRPLDARTLLVEWNPIEEKHQSGQNLRYRVSWSEGPIETSVDDFQPEYHAHYIDSKHSQAVLHLNSSEGCRAVTLAIRPINDEGPAPSSTDTVALLSSSGKLRNVRMLDVSVVNATHVNLTWQWIGKNECPTTHSIQLTCSTENGDTATTSISAENSKWTVGGLKPDEQYYCSGTPSDAHGNLGEKSNEMTVHTKEHPPREAPVITRLSLKPLADESGYTTVLEWTSVVAYSGNYTDDVGYKIFIYISETASDPIVLSMPLSRLTDYRNPSARLDGLRLMYMYTVQVAGFNNGGMGPLSAPRSIRLGSAESIEQSFSPYYSYITMLLIVLLSYCL